jgi:hypothetical protein
MKQNKNFMNLILQFIANWYEGEYVLYDNPPDSCVVKIGGSYKRHWTASLARIFVSFYLKHWQWIWTTTIAIFSIWIAIIALKK